MSGRQLRAVSLSLFLSLFVISIPLSAAPRDREGRNPNPFERFVQRVVKNIRTLSDTLSVPIPK